MPSATEKPRAARAEPGAVCQLVVDDLGPDRLRLEGSEGKHLARSLRARPGERVRATDGRGTRAWLEVTRVDRRGADLQVRSREWEAPPARRWWLATRVLGARFDWIVEKAVELGAWGLVPLAEPRGGRKDEAGRLARWSRLSRAALGQCRGAWSLRVSPARELEEVLGGDSLGVTRWAGIWLADPEGVPAAATSSRGLEGDLLLVVGPPEGFAGSEEVALNRVPGVRRIRLGPRRLRSETAALAGLVWAVLEAEALSEARISPGRG